MEAPEVAEEPVEPVAEEKPAEAPAMEAEPAVETPEVAEALPAEETVEPVTEEKPAEAPSMETEPTEVPPDEEPPAEEKETG